MHAMDMNWNLKRVLRVVGGRLLCGPGDMRFDGIGTDSRTIRPGRLFVALRGERFDAHQFIGQVVAKGVCGAVVEASQLRDADLDAMDAKGVACIAVADTTRALGALAAHQRRRVDIPVVAITGSNGKTTTRRMTDHVMAQGYNTLTTRCNFNNEVGVPLTLFNLGVQHRAAVLELGMNHAGEINRLAAICRPTIGLITNVGPAHLEFLHSLEGVARAKGELLAHIADGGHAVLNLDDDHVAALAASASCPVTFFGLSAEAHIRAQAVCATDQGVAFDLVMPSGRTRIQLKTPGRFMVLNALAAAAVGHLVGLRARQIRAGLEAFIPENGRLQVMQTAAGLNIIDDTYNANPASMMAAIDTFAGKREWDQGYLVLGDMLELGAQAPALHTSVGRCAARAKPAGIYAYGDFAADLISGAQAAGMSAGNLFSGDKQAIAADLAGKIAPGDWVLVKGSRGMAMETVVEALQAASGP